ncbi:hypothetical protein JCM3766R1_002826 [Sporobolomyces carnicolor]
MPPKAPERGTQSISSFFKPKPPPSSRQSEIVILDSSDDDQPARPPPTKRVKLEHAGSSESRASPIASTSRPAISTATPPPPATRSYQRLQAFSYTPASLEDGGVVKPLTAVEQKRRESFINKLVGAQAIRDQRRSNYLQDQHFMAPSHDDDDGDERGGQDPLDENHFETDEIMFDDDGGDGGADGENGRLAHNGAKGKGKGKSKEELIATSRFAKFAAVASAAKGRSSTSKDSSPASNVKYTPLEQQVIALRKENPGVLLAIEVGYKFRFFQEDAQTASRVLNIACFPQRQFLTASIPTHRLDLHVRRLLNAGHKVGIVRQLETAALKKVSENKSKPFTRALTNLYTLATFVDELGAQEGGDSTSSSGPTTAALMCLVEDPIGGAGGYEKVRIGIVAVMPSTGEIVWDEFEDGLMRSELETRMLHLQPNELLLQKDLSPATESIVKHLAGRFNSGASGSTCRIERIPKRPTPSKATSAITEFYAESKKRQRSEMKKVPSEIVLEDSDEDGGRPESVTARGEEDMPSASQKTELAVAGGSSSMSSVFELPKLVLVSLASLIAHLSAFNLSALFLHTSCFASFSSRTTMTLNGNTIVNLELLRNSTDYKEQGSLISVLDKCRTTMGKRMLRKWISKPLVSVDAVNQRLDAISEIHSATSNLALSKLRELLKSLPDLERGLSRVHFGRAGPNELLRVLEALTRVGSVFDELGHDGGSTDFGLKSELLRSTARELPKIKRTVRELVDQVNQKMARDGRKENLFEREQDWPELVECKRAKTLVEEEIQEELRKARKVLRKPALQFKQVALEEYLLEVKVSEKNIVPADWLRINGTKAYYRFRSPSLQTKIQELEQARERLAAAANAAYLSFLQEVASHYAAFRSTIAQLSTLDCLFSLALVALSHNYTKPKIVSEPGSLVIEQGRHPIIEQFSSEPFVPNSVSFGTEFNRKQMILTGLNMGGKSSLAKSIALIALMAQIGSFVPAEACTTSLFDGIYTRMGASDSIIQNRSTFMLELVETSEILKLASNRSLILLDELGRGTSTNDGEAIASSVLEWISRHQHSLTVFVTHYPNVASLAKKYPHSITTNHMACLEAGEEGNRDDGAIAQDPSDDVTFLYKLVPGLASSSHGLNVARMAGIPESVLSIARRKRIELESAVRDRVEARKRNKLEMALRALARQQQRRDAGDADSDEEEDGRKLIELCKTLA